MCSLGSTHGATVLGCCAQYRAKRSWTSAAWILPRTLDKVVITLIMVSLFYGQGDNEGTVSVAVRVGNVAQIQACLCMGTVSAQRPLALLASPLCHALIMRCESASILRFLVGRGHGHPCTARYAQGQHEDEA